MKLTTLGDIALEVVDGPFGSNLPASAYVYAGIPVIRGANLSLGSEKFKDHEFVYVSDETFRKLKRSECLAGDILFTKKGTIGQTGFIPKQSRFEKFLLSSNQMRLRVDPEKAISEYVYYVVSSDISVAKIKRESESTGVPKINLNYLKNFEIELPSLERQAKTVDVLNSLNNKIDLNHKTNQTLEQMAQALFKSWFVDFDPVLDNALAAGNPIPEPLRQQATRRQAAQQLPDVSPLPADIRALFPCEFEQTDEPSVGIAGWVPKGWEIKTFNHFCSINPESWSKKHFPELIQYVDLANAKNGTILEKVTYEYSEAPSRARRVLRSHDVVFGLVRPANCSFAYIGEEGLTGSTGFAVLRPVKTNYRAFNYLSLTNDDRISDFARIADGAAYPAIKPEDISVALCLYSSESILTSFERIIGQMFLKKAELEKEQGLLTKLRDTLLPKLISGEISLDQVTVE